MKKVRRSRDGKVLHLDSSTANRGGEGTVFSVRGEDLAVKVYHDSGHVNRRKLQAMLARPPQDPMRKHNWTSIAWPTSLVERGGTTCGFAMPEIDGADILYNFLNPKKRRKRHGRFHYRYLHRLGHNLASAVAAVHEQDHVISDVNAQNALATERGLVALIDCDSWQIRDVKRGRTHLCPVGRREFTPPENQGKSFAKVVCARSHDQFGLGVLLFMLLMEGHHPFAGRYKRSGHPPMPWERIARGQWPYSSSTKQYEPRPSSPPFAMLAPPLQNLFSRCFEKGLQSPQCRPSAKTWARALRNVESSLVRCCQQPRHYYPPHLSTCPWCRYMSKIGQDPFPSSQSRTSTPGRTGTKDGRSPRNSPNGQAQSRRQQGGKTPTGKKSAKKQGQRSASQPKSGSNPGFFAATPSLPGFPSLSASEMSLTSPASMDNSASKPPVEATSPPVAASLSQNTSSLTSPDF